MSQTLTVVQPIDQIPILPEIHPLEPIVQCGVLYLGTAPPSAGLRGVDSIQQPFSHRYPVDGTNTVRGIDAVLSVYDYGVQLAFTRQPHAVIYFPISSLIYCASLRFTIVENDQSKPSSPIDWRFMPVDTVTDDDCKHPPLFCAVIQRTQFLPGAECHCFITKSSDAAIALVQTISQVYTNIQPMQQLKSPIFYQLDRYGRKLSEITGVIYISPATDDDSQLNRLTDETMARNYLFDPDYDGFFYRTDASLIEQWQLWDDDDLTNSRPRPPASPFGLHEGLYHDDTTDEIQRYLRHMDDEDRSCSCSSSAKSSTSSSSRTTSSVPTEYSPKPNQSHLKKSKTMDDTDLFNLPVSNLQASSFEPIQPRKHSGKKKRPIIIEKSSPDQGYPFLSSILNYHHQLQIHRIQTKNYFSTAIKHPIRFRYPTKLMIEQSILPTHRSSKSHRRSHRHPPSKQIPIIDLQTIERSFNETKSKNALRSRMKIDHQTKEQAQYSRTTPIQFEILEQYFEDYQGNKINSNNLTTRSLLTDLIQSKNRHKQSSPRKSSIASSTPSSKNETYQHRGQSTITTGRSINYVERSLHPSRPQSPKRPVLTDEKLNEFVTNIYGTARSIKSISSSTTHPSSKSIVRPAVVNPTYMAGFRYMQNGMNRNLLEDYRNAY